MTAQRPQVALVAPYWDFWEDSAEIDLRARLAGLLDEVSRLVGEGRDVAVETLVGAQDVRRVGERLRASAPSAVMVVQTMAVPPAWTAEVLDRLPDTPIVVWAMHTADGPEDTYSHAEVTAEGATVGSAQLVNVLLRRGRRPTLVVGRLTDSYTRARIRATIGGAVAAERLSRSRIGRIGEPPPGYECVTCSHEELEAGLGVAVVELPPEQLAERVHGVDDERLELLRDEVTAAFALDADLATADQALDRSLRFAAALEQLDDELELDAGAVNCHLPELRFADDIGVAPCFALGRETSRGQPWTCAGDILTAVAMLTTKRLGAPSLYHELETIDYRTEELVVANTGEHDLGWVPVSERATLGRNRWFERDPVCGACARFTLPAGEATLVAFTPHPDAPGGFRYVVAEGQMSGRGFPGVGTPNGAFRFDGLSAVDGYSAWVLAGANHHSSAAPGHLGAGIAAVAQHLGIECVEVTA